MVQTPEPRPDYSELKVPPPVRGLVQSVEVKDGHDKVEFTTENEARYVLYVPHNNDVHKSGLRKGHGLILRRAHEADPFGVISVRAFLETGVNQDTPLSKQQTVRVGLRPFYFDAEAVKTPILVGKVDEMVQWEAGWHSLVVEAARLNHISIPEGDLWREQTYGKPDEGAPRLRVASRDRVIAFPTRQVGFFYLRTGGFRGFSAVKPSLLPNPI